MPAPPKRPAPPVPDPNWERDLHPSEGGAQGAPESRDPLLAHAVLHRGEPEPLDLDLFDELSDLDRATVPPPEAMHDHVARMMAEATLFEAFDNTGDRPTPLIEVPDGAPKPRDSASGRAEAPVAKPPLQAARPPPLPATAPTVRPPAPQTAAPKPSAKAAASKPVSVPMRPTPPPGAVRPPMKPTPPPGALRTPERNGQGSGQYSAVAPRTKARSEVPPKQSELVLDDLAWDHAAAPEAADAPRGRLDSLDFSDLPAVFALDGLEVDDPAISPDPWSEPAISPPFDSADLQRAESPGATADKVAAIEARMAAGEYGPALMLAEAALEEHPGAPAIEAQAESCREVLYRRYLERLGASDHVPRIAVQHGAITGLSLDHRAGFLLSCIDGGSTIEEIIDVSAMPRLDAVRILYELVQEGVIEMAAR